MKVVANITKEDYWNFNKYTMLHIPKVRNTMLFGMLGTPILTFIVLNFFNFPLLYTILAALVFGVLADWTLIYFTKHRVMSLVEGSEGLLGEHVFEIGENGLVERTSVNESHFSWDGIAAIKRDKHNIYVFISQIQGHIIPRSSFSSSEEEEQFYNELLKYSRK